jgi:hypothetical protein
MHVRIVRSQAILDVRMLKEPARACKNDLEYHAPRHNGRFTKEGKREVGGLNFNIVAGPMILSEPINGVGAHVRRKVVNEDGPGDSQARSTIGKIFNICIRCRLLGRLGLDPSRLGGTLLSRHDVSCVFF